MPTQVSPRMEQDATTTNENPSVIADGGSEPAKEDEIWQRLVRFVLYMTFFFRLSWADCSQTHSKVALRSSEKTRRRGYLCKLTTSYQSGTAFMRIIGFNVIS